MSSPAGTEGTGSEVAPSVPMSGIRRAAILMISLGKDKAARVLARLPERMVEDITAEIVRLKDVSTGEATQVLAEAQAQLLAENGGKGGMDLARQMLVESLGEMRAGEIMDRLGASLADMPFEELRRGEPRQLLTFLGDEHPQTIAVVLAHLSPAQAATVLAGIDGDLQAEVAYRIASMERATPDVIRLVERELDRRMSTVVNTHETATVGGVAPLIAIMNRADRTTERMILDGLESVNAELAEEVRKQMFVFEDVVTLDDKAIQLVLRNVQASDLALALKGVPVAVRDKITKNLSTRAAQNLVEEIEMLGAVRISQVEEAQAKVVQEIRTLEQSGQILIMRGGDEAFIT